MNTTVRQVGKKWIVRYGDGDYFGDYVADNQTDAEAFASNLERQAKDRAFAAQQFRAKMGL